MRVTSAMDPSPRKVINCSRRIKRHQAAHRSRFFDEGSKKKPVEATETTSPVNGLVTLGTRSPMPKPLSRTQ